MSRFLEYIEEKKKCEKKKKEVSEATLKLTFGGLNLHDNILDDITVEELQTMVYSNIPSEKINDAVVKKEFESLLREKVNDARSIARKVIPDLVKDLKGRE